MLVAEKWALEIKRTFRINSRSRILVFFYTLCTYRCYAGGEGEGGGGGGRQGMGWGLDCLCWPWGRAFDWSYSPRRGDIWIFLRPMWRYLTTYVRVNLIFKPLLASGTRMEFNCQRSSRAKKRGCLGGRFIMPRNVGKNSQIRHNPLKFAFLTIFGREQTTIPINLWRKKTSWRVFWRTSNSSPLYPRNLLPKELSLKMYQGCPMTSLYVPVGVTTIGVNRVRALCAYAEKNISLWLQLLLANAWLFSVDVVAVVEGVDVVRKENFPRWELKNNFRLFSQPPSTENSVVDRKAS